jgi:hypothetical protein
MQRSTHTMLTTVVRLLKGVLNAVDDWLKESKPQD